MEQHSMFWIVWSPGGERPPKFRHDDKALAIQEAERLATAHPGQRFYVMGAEALRVFDAMQRIDAFKHEIPF